MTKNRKSLLSNLMEIRVQFMLKSALFIVLLAAGSSLKAQTTLGRFLSFDFSTATAANNPSSFPVFSGNNAIDTSGVVITRGNGYNAASNNETRNGSFSFKNLYQPNFAGAKSAGDYIEFLVRPKQGFEVRLDSLMFRWQYSAASINSVNFAIATSTDGFNQVLGTTSTVSNAVVFGNNVTSLVLTKPLFESDTFRVRIYIWDNAQGNGAPARRFYFTDGTDNNTFSQDISVFGRTTNAKQIMQAFDFSNATGAELARPTFTANTTFIDTNNVTITRGLGLSAQTSTVGSYGANGFNTNSLAGAIAANDFFQFMLKAQNGYQFTLDRIALRYFAANGITNYALRSSLDNYSSNLATGTWTTNVNTTETIQLSTPLTAEIPVTFRLYLWTNGSTNLQFRFTDGTSPNSVNYDIAMYGNMSISDIPSAVLSAPDATTTCLGGGISLNVSTTSGTAPFTVWLKDNLGQTRSHVQWDADTTFTIFPQSNRTYSIDSVRDAMGRKANNISGTVSVTVINSPVVTGVGVYSRTLNHLDGYTLTYADGASCRSLVRIADSTGGNTFGSTTATVTIQASTPINGTSRYFLPRFVRLQPSNNGNGLVTFYFTQAEFSAFNTAAQYHNKYPANPSDTANVLQEILIGRTQGSMETDSMSFFAPSSVVWNSTNAHWEVTLRVQDGNLNGFYFFTSLFNTLKMVNTVSHIASTPNGGASVASVTVNWDSIAGVNQFRFRFRPMGGTWNASTVNGRQRVMGNLSFNTTYEVQVRVFESQINQFMQGEYTRTYTFTTPSEPNRMPACSPPPVSVTVNNPLSATLNWPGVIEGVSYLVQIRAKNTLAWGGSSTTGNSESFNALTPNTTYEFRVRTSCTPGMTVNGNSEFSAIDTFRTPALENCGTVSNITVTETTTNSANISWAPVLYTTTYLVQTRLKNGGAWGGTSTTSTSININGLMASSEYEIRIRPTCNPALTLSANGGFSDHVSFTTQSSTPVVNCLPPSNIQANPASNHIILSWDGVDNDTLYFVQIKREDAASWGGGSTNGKSRRMNNLQPNTNYQIRIRTTCKPGSTLNATSTFSDTILVATTPMANKFAVSDVENTAIRVYPNPTRDWLRIDYTSQTEEKIHVIVRDMTGRVINTTEVVPMVGENPIEINLQQAPEGLYLVQIIQGNTLKFTNRVQKL